MPLKTSALNSIREVFDLPYAGDTIHITYNPQGFTPALEREINDLREKESSAQAVVKILKSMLLDWDLVEDDPDKPGEARPFGTDAEKLEALPVKFLGDVAGAIAEEIKALSEKGKTSGGTSLQKVS